MEMRESYFDGGVLNMIGYALLAWLITAVTFGFGGPYAMVLMFRWQAKHTVYDGRRLVFEGKAGNLFLHFMLWYLLTIITFGIYGFWLTIKLEKWRVQNLSVDISNSDIQGYGGYGAYNYNDAYMMRGESYFDGGLLQLIGYGILGALVTVCTLGICFPWAVTMILNWKIKHTVIEGRRLEFEGTAPELFGRWIVWLILTIITLGIYGLWVAIRMIQWEVEHTHFM